MNDETITGSAAAIFMVLFLIYQFILKPFWGEKNRANTLDYIKKHPLGMIVTAMMMANLLAFFIGLATGNNPLFFYSFGGLICISVAGAIVSHIKRGKS